MKNLIVVDDQDVFREPLCQALRQKGYTVYEAADGGTAIELAERHQPDLALVDVRMPEMDGMELARKVSQAYPDLHILFMSGYADDIVYAHEDLAGVSSFMP